MVCGVGLRSFFGLDLVEPDVDPDQVAFSQSAEDLVGDADIDPAVFGLEGYSSSTSPAPRVTRKAAIQVPAVKRCRDMICGPLGGLPLDLYAADRTPIEPSPFEQPERSLARSVSMTRLFEDLLFEGIAWWDIVESGFRDYPLFFKRLRPGRVTVDEDRGKIYVDGKERADHGTLIRFDSPTDGLLIAGARAIRTCLALDAAAADAADGVPAVQYFTPAENADPGDDDEIEALLDKAQAARRERRIGYVPAALNLHDGTWDPKKLQLVEQRQHAVLEIARVAGIDPEELGVSTTSRTYANQFDRRKAFLDFTLAPYIDAVQDRLSMGDVNPRGQFVRFDLNKFLRSDPASRWSSYEVGLRVGAIDEDDIARMEDKPAGSVQPRQLASVTPLPRPQEETA